MPDPAQRLIAAVAAVITLPLVGALGLAIRLDTEGPAIYRAERTSRGGGRFICFKLRTMTWRPGSEASQLTLVEDPRLTRVGRVLRRFRLDELPQLWNVVRGEMRLVGPRPEAPAFVDLTDPLHREVFAEPPGITGLTQLFYVDEASRLRTADPERHYREAILPAKLRLDAAYLRHRTLALDLWILAQTPRAILGRPLHLPAALAAEVGGVTPAPRQPA